MKPTPNPSREGSWGAFHPERGDGEHSIPGGEIGSIPSREGSRRVFPPESGAGKDCPWS